MIFNKYKELYKRQSSIFENLTYITALQLFVMATPLITYPYLVRVLGKELYGWVITAQIVASYCSIFIDFGFKSVSAKHISIHRNNQEKLSEIISTILLSQWIIWIFCLIGYLFIIYWIPAYREHLWLFIFSFGLTFNELLFPQYYFQGIEKMKYITLINVFIRLIFVILTFFVIKSSQDYIYVPLISTIGYIIGGLWALYIIFIKHRIRFIMPAFNTISFYMKDAAPIFFTDIICTIKDKLNYLLLGGCVGMKEVVAYDLGSRFTNILVKPSSILATVLFPKMAKEKNIHLAQKICIIILIGMIICVLSLNLFLPQIVHFFIADTIDLLPIRLYTLAPIILGLSSYIASNIIIALGYNKYILYSIIITTCIYLSLLALFYLEGYLNTITSFILLTLFSYMGELIYRLIIAKKIAILEQQ